MTEHEKKLLQDKHRLEEAQARDRVKERKARTRRLIQEGAILEKALPQVQRMTLEQLEDFLWEVFKCSMSWERSGKPGRFSFFPKGALTHHPEGAVVFPAEIVRSPRGIAASADAAGQGCISVKLPALSMQSVRGVHFVSPLFMGWYIATPSRRLPVSTCHRQLDTGTGV